MRNELRRRRVMFEIECYDDTCERCQLCLVQGSGDARHRDRTQECREAELRVTHYDEILRRVCEMAELKMSLGKKFGDCQSPTRKKKTKRCQRNQHQHDT